MPSSITIVFLPGISIVELHSASTITRKTKTHLRVECKKYSELQKKTNLIPIYGAIINQYSLCYFNYGENG